MLLKLSKKMSAPPFIHSSLINKAENPLTAPCETIIILTKHQSKMR